ncbi:MAG: winged helix-turn-helix transcriptional regulator [Nanoarchaeota archaeon]
MENKKLGILMILISLVFLLFLISFNIKMSEKSLELGCKTTEECEPVEDILSMMHIGFGFFGFMLALGFYILFFNKTEKAILKKLEQEKEQKIENIKFDIIMKALDPFEQKVIKAIREQEGITQNTLRLRANMSKAKLSYVLQELERRGIIKRIKKGKTLAIYLKI